MVESGVSAFLRKDGTEFLAAIGSIGSGDSGDAQLWRLVNETRPWTCIHTFPDSSTCHDLIIYADDIYAALEDVEADKGVVKKSTDGGFSFSFEFEIDHFTDYASALGILGTELFVGEKNTDGVEFPSIYGRTGGGAWTLRHAADRNAIIEWTAFKQFGSFLYCATHANGSDAFGPEIWRTSDGSAFTKVETFPSDYERIDALEVFQSKIFATITNANTNNVVVWESSDGLTWTDHPPLVSVGNCQARGLVTDGTNLFTGQLCTSGATETVVYVYNGVSWSVSVDFWADISGFSTNGASRVNTLGYNPDANKIYAGCGSAPGGSTGQVAIMVCPSVDLGTANDPDEDSLDHIGPSEWSVDKDFKGDAESDVPGAVTAFANFNSDFYAATSEMHELGGEASTHGQVWRWNSGTWVLHHQFAAGTEFVEDIINFGGDLYATVETGVLDQGEIWVDTGGGFALEFDMPIGVPGPTELRGRNHRFGIFGGELYVAGTDSNSFIYQATIWKQTAPGTWIMVKHFGDAPTIHRQGVAFKEFGGKFYFAEGVHVAGYNLGPGSAHAPAQIWESVDGTTWVLNHTFLTPFDGISDLEVFQGNLYAAICRREITPIPATSEREVWRYDGVTWTKSTVINQRTSPSPSSEAEFTTRFLNLSDIQLLLGLGADSFSFDSGPNTWDTGDQRILSFDGSCWIEAVNLGIDNAAVRALGENDQDIDVYAGAGNSFADGNQSDYQAKIHVCEPGGGGGGGGGG